MATGGESSGITSAELHELMASMRQGIKDEISTLKREQSEEREAADAKLIKKMKLDKAPVFKKKDTRSSIGTGRRSADAIYGCSLGPRRDAT